MKIKFAVYLLLIPLFIFSYRSCQGREETTLYLGSLESSYNERGDLISRKVALGAGAATIVRTTNYQTKESSISYLYPDHLSSTTVIDTYNDKGNQRTTLSYYPYGNTRDTKDTKEDRLYTSQRKDTLSSLYFYNARYYNSTSSHFISADKAEGPNRYSYVGNNPVGRNDPTGNYDEDAGVGREMRKKLSPSYQKWIEKKYKIKLRNVGEGFWTNGEAWLLTNVLNKMPDGAGRVYMGKTFVRYEDNEKYLGFSASSSRYPMATFFGIAPYGTKSLDQSDLSELTSMSRKDQKKMLSQSAEWLSAHEIAHSWAIFYPDDVTLFYKTMRNQNFDWITLSLENFDAYDARDYPGLREKQEKSQSLADYYQSKGYKIFINGYKNLVGVRNGDNLLTEYSAANLNEAFAEYFAYYLLSQKDKAKDNETGIYFPNNYFRKIFKNKSCNLPIFCD